MFSSGVEGVGETDSETLPALGWVAHRSTGEAEGWDADGAGAVVAASGVQPGSCWASSSVVI